MMGRLPRNTNPDYLRHISIRTECARLLLLPDPVLNNIIGGIIAKYQEEFSIIIYAYTVLGNHLHLLVQAPAQNLWRFEQAVNREIAKRINRHRRRRGHFWERRYDEQIVPEEADILEAFLYVVCNPVSHGLVEHPALWPGLSCYHQVLDGKGRTFKFASLTRYRESIQRSAFTGRRIDRAEYQSEYTLRLSPLPGWENLSFKQRCERYRELIAVRVRRIVKRRRGEGLGFLGKQAVIKQRFDDVPLNVKRFPRPICYTKNLETKKRFKEWFYPWVAQVREASRIFRSGRFLVPFPPFCLRPPVHYSLRMG